MNAPTPDRLIGTGRARSLVSWFCESRFTSSLRRLWQQNQENSHMALSAAQKARLGLFLAMRDWAAGGFPPKFQREPAWENERHFASSLSGLTKERALELSNAKPFEFTTSEFETHTRNFSRIRAILRQAGIAPPARIIELGCGQGWLSEMLANTGFNVIGTSISEVEVQEAMRRAEAFRCRGIPGSLDFAVYPMEQIGRHFSGFDCAIVYESLHHAFDWKETIHSVSAALAPGGWFLICDEPNVAHTLISYRVGKLTSTHEIGIPRRTLINELRQAGFTPIRSYSSALHFWLGWHWLAAKR